MLRRDLFLALMVTSQVCWLGPWMPPDSGGAAIEGPNAADVYGEASGRSKGSCAEDPQRLRKAPTIAVDDPHVGALIQQARPVLEAIREAAAIDRCCSRDSIVTTADLGKGYLDASNLEVIHVACLSARRQARWGQARDALDEMFAGLSLAHRLGTGGFLFVRVLECGGEMASFRALAHILPGRERATLDDLSRRLGVLPPPEPASAVIGPESRFILGSLRAKLMAIGPVVEGAGWAAPGFDEKKSKTISSGGWASSSGTKSAKGSARCAST